MWSGGQGCLATAVRLWHAGILNDDALTALGHARGSSTDVSKLWCRISICKACKSPGCFIPFPAIKTRSRTRAMLRATGTHVLEKHLNKLQFAA